MSRQRVPTYATLSDEMREQIVNSYLGGFGVAASLGGSVSQLVGSVAQNIFGFSRADMSKSRGLNGYALCLAVLVQAGVIQSDLFSLCESVRPGEKS